MTTSICKQHGWFLTALFFLSLFLRAAIFQSYLGKNENFWQVDSSTYHLMAQSIAAGKGVAHSDGRPQFYRVPGYPLFLAASYVFLGSDKKIALWVQVVLASIIPILIFLLSLTLFPGMVLLARCASLYAACHLGFLLFSGFFMTESLFIFLFLLFALCFFKRPSTGLSLFFAGLFLGAAGMVRPVGHYLLILTMLVLLFLQQGGILKKIYRISWLTLGWLLPVVWWLLRNYLLTGYLFFHTLPGGHFLYLSAARVAMHEHDCSYQEARRLLSQQAATAMQQRENALGRPLHEIEQCLVNESLAVTYFKMRPLTAAKNWCTDMARTMFSLYSAELLYLQSGRQEVDYFNKQRGPWSMVSRYLFPPTDSWFLRLIIYCEMLFFLFILLGFALGLYQIGLKIFRCGLASFQQPDFAVWLEVLPYMLFFVVIALSGGYARMRLPLEPFLIILSLWSFQKAFTRANFFIKQ